ncbi:MAG TPA: sigma-70 family RNA polymerase sigma factor [Polyangiaceae bacterium]|nr:sigma-70 family RNA polymerase sigma factor [Polyangiaceae bacterium]
MALTVSPALFDAARAGDAGAIGRLLELSRPELRRYAQRSCIITDVEDAVQEAMWTLARYVGTLQSVRALTTWLFRVTRRECRRLARKTLGLDLWDDSKTEAVMARLPPPTLRLEVAAAIQSLPEHYRDVLLLRDFEELTIAELAERLALSEANVKSRLFRARELVREYLLSGGPGAPAGS